MEHCWRGILRHCWDSCCFGTRRQFCAGAALGVHSCYSIISWLRILPALLSWNTLALLPWHTAALLPWHFLALLLRYLLLNRPTLLAWNSKTSLFLNPSRHSFTLLSWNCGALLPWHCAASIGALDYCVSNKVQQIMTLSQTLAPS